MIKYYIVDKGIIPRQVKLAEFIESLGSAAIESKETHSISLEETNAED